MRIFKYIILTLVTFLVTNVNTLAQSYSIIPNDTIQISGVLEDLETLSIQQQNNSNDTLFLEWKKVSESVPLFWDASICDNSFCYTSLIDSGYMNPVIPGDYGLMLLHITPHVNYGTAIIRYAVWDALTPNLKDTLTYILHVVPTGFTSISRDEIPLKIIKNKIFINQNQNTFSVLRLLNMNGKIIYETAINNKSEIDLPSIPTANYIVQLIGQQKIYSQKISHIK